ncbi:MAG: glycoside hydrolase domain-containing protein [Kiritimatiellia bacterium]
MNTRILLAAAGFALAAWAGMPWRDDLWLGHGSFWTARVPVTVENPTAANWEGKTVSVPIAKLPLAGACVEELRLVDAQGVQLEYGVWSGNGLEQMTEGPVPKDGFFTIPVVCPAKGRADYHIYFGNAKAWGLADFWEERPVGFVNGGFEVVRAGAPLGWRTFSADGQHRLEIVEGAVEGKHCLRAEADEGASATWFNYSQDNIPVRPGQKVTVRVKLRGENVKGIAGWYIHAGNEVRGDILNKVFTGGQGTFGWKTLEMKVEIPADCSRMCVGSVLKGTGRAWYDDVTVDLGTANDAPDIAVGAVETLDVRSIGEDAPWLDPKWQYRVPVRLANFTDADVASTLASFALPEVLRATRNPEYVLTLNGQPLQACALGTRLLFSCTLPAKSVTTCYIYVRCGDAKTAVTEEAAERKSALGSQIPSDQVLVRRAKLSDPAAFEALLNSAGNLVRNGSFEEGEAGWRHGTAKGVSCTTAEGGYFGKGCAKMVIPTGVAPNWSGWRQTVEVKPGRSYFYGAFISGDNLESSATVHAHLLTAKGALSSGGMQCAGSGVSGTVPWTPVFGTLYAPADTAKVNLQLTMNGAGTVAHDGVLMVEYTVAKTGDPEFAPVRDAGRPLVVEQVDPVVKVFRETPLAGTDGTLLRVVLARNETEPLQVAVKSVTGGELELAVEGIPLKTEIGRVDFVPVDWPTAYYSCTTPKWVLRFPKNSGQSDGWSGWWPDPIVPTSRGTLVPNQTQPFWVNFTADARTKPGTYNGQIVWRLNGQVVRTDALAVKVWNFEIPARPKFAAVYDLRMGGPYWQTLGATDDVRREKIWAFMAEKKACPDGPGGGVTFTKGADGNLTADFTEYDRLATRYFDHYQFPMAYTPGCFYCFGWAMPPKKFLGEDPYEGVWPYAGADRMKLRPEYRRLYQQALKLYWDHVKAKGWADRIALYISDEPHFTRPEVRDQMIACCRMIHEVDPAIRIYSSTWRHCPAWNDALDVWGVGHYGCFPVEEMRARKAAGGSIWWTTDGQMCTDTPYCAVERLLPHYAHKYGADLYEFWGATWLTYDPWKFGWHAYIRQSDTPGKTYWVRYPAGDGYLIYPPREGMEATPVSSIRMEAARDGVEDHSYLELLAARAKSNPAAAALLEEYRALVTIPNAGGRHSTHILPEPEKIGALRLRAGELLAR